MSFLPKDCIASPSFLPVRPDANLLDKERHAIDSRVPAETQR